MTPHVVEVRKKVLSKNDELARGLRTRLRDAGVFTLNLVSSPGTGKTALLQKTLMELLAHGHRVAALVGDLETDNDARRLAESGAPVKQIQTHGCCHLEAGMISSHLEGWELDQFDFLFIENVGNLVCPANYDLGEDLRIALLSVTEGEDKPLKYPSMFHSAQVAVITKMDLAEACDFDRETAIANIRSVQPDIRVLEVSAKKGTGMREWIDYLVSARGATVL
jgi:hydrogenase nickel incorporation protein HypB